MTLRFLTDREDWHGNAIQRMPTQSDLIAALDPDAMTDADRAKLIAMVGRMTGADPVAVVKSLPSRLATERAHHPAWKTSGDIPLHKAPPAAVLAEARRQARDEERAEWHAMLGINEEPADMLKGTGVLENCVECGQSTTLWLDGGDVPIHPGCLESYARRQAIDQCADVVKTTADSYGPYNTARERLADVEREIRALKVTP